MEVNPSVPENYFDLVFSIYGVGWTTDLPATMALISGYLRPGGCFILSGEHPAYTFLGQIIHAGLQIEALVETPVAPTAVKEEHIDPARWCSVARAQ